MCMVTLVYTDGERVCEGTYRESGVEGIIAELGSRFLGAIYRWKPGERPNIRY